MARDPWDDAGAYALIGSVGVLAAFVLLVAIAGLSISPAVWYIARAAGMTTYLLLWFSVMTGLGLSTRLFGFIGDQGIVLQLHRLATDLSIAGVALHLFAIAVDPAVEIGMLGALIPMMSSVRQPWTDLGIIAAYGMIGIALSFAVRRWIGSDRWRALHYLTFGFWAMALVHAIGAGTDTGTLWAGSIYVLSASSVVFLLTFRLLHAGGGKSRARGRRAGRSRPVGSSA